MAAPPFPYRFRLGDIWRSPRDKDWMVEKLHHTKGAFLRAMHNRHTTQWRNELATGGNRPGAWVRVHSGSQELHVVQSASEGD
jgi:hypothetical protein